MNKQEYIHLASKFSIDQMLGESYLMDMNEIDQFIDSSDNTIKMINLALNEEGVSKKMLKTALEHSLIFIMSSTSRMLNINRAGSLYKNKL